MYRIFLGSCLVAFFFAFFAYRLLDSKVLLLQKQEALAGRHTITASKLTNASILKVSGKSVYAEDLQLSYLSICMRRLSSGMHMIDLPARSCKEFSSQCESLETS
jgi:hypothetical protein